MLARVKDLLERNDTASARALCDLAIRAAPNDANAYLLAGRIAGLQERWSDALALFERCVLLAPQAAAPHFWLGNAYRALGDNATAVVAFGNANRLSPGDSATAFNLGLSFQSLGDTASAGRAFVMAARSSGATFDAEAHQHMIECAMAQSLSPLPRTLKLRSTAGRSDVTVSVVCCSITPAKAVALRINLTQVLAGRRWELVLIEDARSLCEGYQRGIAQSCGEIIILCHDDIEIIVEDLYERLVDALDDAEIVGVAGTTRVNGPAVFWARHPYCHGWVTQARTNGDLLPTPMSVNQPRVEGAQALDGLFFAARRSVFEYVQFDAITFDGFHFYDLDFTYRAYLAGLRLRIQCDILIIHSSSGNFDQTYMRYAEKFARKFPDVPCASASPAIRFKTLAPDKQALRAMYAWMEHWVSP